MKQTLFEATGMIREEYLEEAAEAAAAKKPKWFIRAVAAAAALALLIGAGLLMKTADAPTEPVPFFAVRAYAADGSIATLAAQGDSIQTVSGSDALFPGKETYTLDISLGEYSGNPEDFREGTFHFLHRGKLLEPGENDEYLKIDWLKTDDFYGYRITGWCESLDIIELTIRDETGKIIHEKSMRIDYDGSYHVRVRSSFIYQEGMNTGELIDLILSQDYTMTLGLASSPTAAYSFLVSGHGGFAELEERADAPAILLERYVNSVENGIPKDSIVGLMLSRDIYWEKLTQEQKELFASFGVWRDLDSPDQDKTILDITFPGKEFFEYEVLFSGENIYGYAIDISYNGHTVSGDDEHIMTFHITSASWAKDPAFGWRIHGWFDEPTVLSITVADENGNVVRQEDVQIHYDEGYHYEVIEPGT